jgi:hypothetical protein
MNILPSCITLVLYIYQLDHVAISKKWRSLLDVRSYRGADVASNHHLVVAHLRLKLAAHKVSGHRVTLKKFNIEKFNHGETREKCEGELKKNLDQERINELNSSEHFTVLKSYSPKARVYWS